MKWYSDFIFWNRTTNDVLGIESLVEGTQRDHAQSLAQLHRVTVSYAKVEEYFVEPTLCPLCGEGLPESGMCTCFEGEAPNPTLAEMLANEAEIRAKVYREFFGKELQ